MDRRQEDIPIVQTYSMTEEEWQARQSETNKSIVDPAAAAAHKHLSWSPDGEHLNARVDEADAAVVVEPEESFLTYTGNPDGTFIVTVHLNRRDMGAVQSEQSTGEKRSDILDAARRAFEKADRALEALADFVSSEEIG